MKVVMLEDEPLVAKSLEKQLLEVMPSAQLLTRLDSVESALQWFAKNEAPDLILSDIQLSDGVSFDVFKQLNITTPVIFTTAYNEYALRAFKLNSIDYLLKPIDKNELKAALDKFERHRSVAPDQLHTRIHALMETLQGSERKFKTRFTAHQQGKVVALAEGELAYFLKEDIVFAVTAENKKLICDYHSLDELEELVKPDLFFRADRQHLVNRSFIQSFRVHHSGKLELQLKAPLREVLTVSKEKAHRFRQWFEGN